MFERMSTNVKVLGEVDAKVHLHEEDGVNSTALRTWRPAPDSA